MKSPIKKVVVIIIALGILFAFSSIVNHFLTFIERRMEYRDKLNLDCRKASPSEILEYIYINGNLGWAAFKAAENCTGNGTYSEPYVIEDRVMGIESMDACIFIENSDVYFKIENCSIIHGNNYGILLSNVKNSQLINNNCSFNNYGITLWFCTNNTISGNILNYNRVNGIELGSCYNNTITGNSMTECGLVLDDPIEEVGSHNIDVSNLVNGKPLYYYINEIHLGPSNFTNPGQIILINCNKSIISNLNISYASQGITLFWCNNNTISGNTVSYNYNGIFVEYSNYNNISNNMVSFNHDGIFVEYSNNNNISRNKANGNSHTGIFLSSCEYNTILGNTASNNYHASIYLQESHSNSILNNTACDNKYVGIILECSNNSIISGNTANNNGWAGIKLAYSSFNSITENTFIGNLVCTSQLHCEGNFIENNYCKNRPTIPSFDVFFLITITFIAMIIIALFKRKKIKKF